MAIQFDVDGIERGAYDASLYAAAKVYDDAVNGWESVGEAELQLYREQGFFLVRDAFPAHIVEGVKQGIFELVRNGVIADGRAQLQFENADSARLAEMSDEERLDHVRKLMNFVQQNAQVRAMTDWPPMLAVVARLLGEQGAMFQDMALLKPPKIGREKPWHQDQAYFNLPEGTPVVGLWIALDDATVDNGCMHFLAGGHKAGPIAHFDRRDWQICDTDVLGNEVTAVPVPAGWALVFDSLTPHGTPHNDSGARRRAMQMHYRPASIRMLGDSEERVRIFGGDGQGKTC